MRRLTLAAILVSLSIHSTAWASDSLVIHEASRPDAQGSPANVVGSTIHSTTWLSLEAHYLRRLKLPWPARPILIGAGLDLPLFLWGSSGDLDTIRLSVRGTAEVYRIRWFSLVVDLQSRLGVQDSVLNTSVGWDFQITLAPSLHLRAGLSPRLWRYGRGSPPTSSTARSCTTPSMTVIPMARLALPAQKTDGSPEATRGSRLVSPLVSTFPASLLSMVRPD